MAKVNHFTVSESPNGYGFLIHENGDGENELFVAISSGQGGATAFGIILATVDMGMNTLCGEVDSGKSADIAKAIDKAVAGICHVRNWHGYTETSRFSEAIYEAVKALNGDE